MASPLFSASTIFAMQAWDVIHGIIAGLRKPIVDLQRNVISVAEGLPASPLPTFAQQVAANYNAGIINLYPDVSAKYLAMARATATSYPRFLGRALPLPRGVRGERLIDTPGADGTPDKSPFDPEDVPEDEDSDLEKFLLLFLLLTDVEIRVAFFSFMLFGMKLDAQWTVFAQRQSLSLLRAISAAGAAAANGHADAILRRHSKDPAAAVLLPLDGPSPSSDSAVRAAVLEEIRALIAGGNGAAAKPTALISVIGSMVQTQAWGVFNDVVGKSLAKNPEIFVGERWVSILDDATCPYCRKLDSKIFTFNAAGDSTAPDCPAHPRCRCHLMPVSVTRSTESIIPAVPEDFGEWFASLPEANRRRLSGNLADHRFGSFLNFLARVPRRDRALSP